MIDKKNIVVTGSSNGIGRLTVETLAKEGHMVFATMRNINSKNANKKEELEVLAKNNNWDINVIELDVTNDSSVKNAFIEIASITEDIDVVINNAGIMFVGVTEAYSIAQVQQQFDTNFFGVLRVNKAVLPYMHKRKQGHIINISSLSGRGIFPFFGVYCASKYALEAIIESSRYELSQLGIDFTIIEPGPFPSNLIGTGPKEAEESVLANYGDLAEYPNKMLAPFESMFNGDEAPNTQEVADTILNLIATPAGTRPLRTVVGLDFGIVGLNKASEPFQDGLLDALGMSDFKQVKTN